MINITLTITATPELLNILSGFLGASGLKKEIKEGTPVQEVKQIENNALQPIQMPAANNTACITPAVPIAPQTPAPAATTPAYTPPQPVQAPVQQPQPRVPAVPTAVQAYTMDQLALAGTQLIDSGHMKELQQLLAAFGVQALTALPKEQYGAFATQLRALGAKL